MLTPTHHPGRLFLLALIAGSAFLLQRQNAYSQDRVSSDGQSERLLNFENDILPVLSRYGCNSSGCHGKAEGQNGFKLSVFGFDPEADYIALVMEGRGRRVFPAVPDQSLLLQKICGSMPHGG